MQDSEGSGEPEEGADEDEDLGEESHISEGDRLHHLRQGDLVAVLVVRRQLVLVIKEGETFEISPG